MPFYDRGCSACSWIAIDVFEPIDPGPCVCPTCGAATERRWISKTSHVIGDACDLWQENGFPQPRHFTSKQELTRALAERGLEVRVRHVPPPGSDRSPATTDWAKGSIDATTLANAAALVHRPAEPRAAWTGPSRIITDDPMIAHAQARQAAETTTPLPSMSTVREKLSDAV